MCVLYLSKVLMYGFHYNYTKNKYCNNSKLLFTDTVSLMNEIKPEDFYEVFSRDKEIFDLSNYGDSNKLVVVKMKDKNRCWCY